MGDMAEYYDERTDDFGSEDWRPRRSPRPDPPSRNVVRYYPKDDAAAQALIQKLGWYVWQTHSLRGTYSENPYILHRMNADDWVEEIQLPGRFGTTLSWLKKERDARA